MKEEFNPTVDNAVDLERSIIDLKAEKAVFVSEKMAKQLIASHLKDQLNNPRISTNEHIEATKGRVLIKSELTGLEMEIKEVNLKIGTKRKLLIAVDNHLKKAKTNLDSENIIVEKIEELKEKYSSFSADHTRISSMRVMAAEVVKELNAILRF